MSHCRWRDSRRLLHAHKHVVIVTGCFFGRSFFVTVFLLRTQLCVSNFEALFEALQSLLNNTPALRAQLAKVSSLLGLLAQSSVVLR